MVHHKDTKICGCNVQRQQKSKKVDSSKIKKGEGYK